MASAASGFSTFLGAVDRDALLWLPTRRKNRNLNRVTMPPKQTVLAAATTPRYELF